MFTLHSVISYYTSCGNTVNVASLDVSKAFDRVCHSILFLKLIKCGVPKLCIQILSSWYRKCSVSVKWINAVSIAYTPKAGIRQGSIVSPALFAVYINNLITRISDSGYGCNIKNIFLGCFLYADDIILLSISVFSLQRMLEICIDELHCIDLHLNVDKSVYTRIGPRWKVSEINLLINGQKLKYSSEIKYLGVVICSGKFVSRSIADMKVKFYRTFYSIFCKLRSCPNVAVLINLVKSKCIPILTYALEGYPLKEGQYKALDKVIYKSIAKIVGTYNVDDINYIKSVFHISDMHVTAHTRYKKLISKLPVKQLGFMSVLLHV